MRNKDIQASDIANDLAKKLTASKVNKIIAKLGKAPCKYAKIQQLLQDGDIANDGEFQREFSSFYRINQARKNDAWKKDYFELLEQAKREKPTYEQVLNDLYEKTNKVECSFASKLLASVNDNYPVIDSRILNNTGLCLCKYVEEPEQKIACAVKIWQTLKRGMEAFLKTPEGQRVVKRFQDKYRDLRIGKMKILDFVLWKYED